MVLGGVYGNLFNLIQEIANFTSTCHIPQDLKYGSFENGKWTGMVADLVYDRADLAVTPLDVTEERMHYIDYLLSIGFSRYMVVMKRPSSSDFLWTTYIQEFHKDVWALLLFSVLVMIVVLYIITGLLPTEEKISLSESFTIVSGCIIAQGYMTSHLP
ncbi:probable glutamate receptor [Penaeus japonicus]|uniref:probable glutamate receptor n=1 Tax=Penaeus japonicus TaxID=27405 RepID=UPI001C70CA3E|nr:probable glutamate receptor [Penaeus japonicus]